MTEDWKHKLGCVCISKYKYPVRNKEVRSNIFEGCDINYNTFSHANTCICCKDRNNQDHFYCGTHSKCVRGNGCTERQMDGLDAGKIKIFECCSSVGSNSNFLS